MPYETDGLVGKIALQKGLISSDQLKECLAQQGILQKAGQKRPLGVIMVSRGLIKDEDLMQLLEEQKRFLAERSNYSEVRRQDFLFGQILIRDGRATPEDINAALRLQAESAERGDMPVPRLGQILAGMGVTDEKAIHHTLKIQYKTIYECPGCSIKYNLIQAEIDKLYRCRRCGEILKVTSVKQGRADESAYGLNLEVNQDLPPEVAAAEKDPANQFDKFILVREIGRGGMGTVYKAYQKDLKRIVAVKILRGDDEETTERFEREARTAARLKHPHIVSVYEIGKYKGVPYLAMEYIEGQALDEIRKPPIRKACALMRDVSVAVHYAHTKGVVHRDLKPQNILLDQEGRPYVTDFGLAREVHGDGKNLTVSGIIVGTPAYMSPEQAQGARTIDGQSDVSSLGCVLYELLTGVQPFTGATPVDVALAVINKDPVPPRQLNAVIHPDLDAICRRALEKDKVRRYESAKALAEDLQRYLEGEPVLAKPPGLLKSTVRRLGKNKLASMFGMVALVLLAAMLGTLYVLTREVRSKGVLMHARELEKEGYLKEALALYERDPDYQADAERLRKAIEHRSKEDLRTAEASYKTEVDETAREQAEAILEAARRAQTPGQRIEHAKRALRVYDRLEEAYLICAQAHEQLGNDEFAYQELLEAARVSAYPLQHYVKRADLARKLGRRKEEVENLARALAYSPLSTELLMRRAEACYAAGEFAAAADDWERAMEIDLELKREVAPRAREARQRAAENGNP